MVIEQKWINIFCQAKFIKNTIGIFLRNVMNRPQRNIIVKIKINKNEI